jgi:prevent-host-death family protein
MRNWNLADAAVTFARVVEEALTRGPQRVVSRERRAVVVLDEAEYQRFAERVPARAVRGFGGKELFEIMQNSPIAAAIRDGDLPEDFLERSREASRHCECCTGRSARNVDAAD